MNRRDLVLAILAASDGQAYEPVQIQKAVFLISQNLPQVVSEGPGFVFAPYDYGPFDRAVYSEAEMLELMGLAQVQQSAKGRWKTYAATAQGVEQGKQVLAAMPDGWANYVNQVSAWVRHLSFANLVKSIYEAYPQMRENSIFQG